ncbi:hypothetical protein [Capnocytophaga granulosa]
MTIIVEPLALYGSYKLHCYRYELQKTRQHRALALLVLLRI